LCIITDLRYDEQIIVFQDRFVRLENIQAFKSYESGKWSRPMALNLAIFGVSWQVYAGIAAVFDPEDPYQLHDAVVTGTSLALGYGLLQIFKSRVYKFKGNRRLRIVDLNPVELDYPEY